ncbi:MAG: hypothetical protein U0797_08710 [Gemmataceae bacterium]
MPGAAQPARRLLAKPRAIEPAPTPVKLINGEKDTSSSLPEDVVRQMGVPGALPGPGPRPAFRRTLTLLGTLAFDPSGCRKV